MTAAAELTIICLDNSFWMHGHRICMAQLEAIKYYCETKFKCNPENRVGLFRMGSFRYGTMLSLTSDLQQILYYLRGIHFECDGQADFSDALEDTSADFLDSPPNMKRSPINLHIALVKPLGRILKERDIALDVVNFFILGEDKSRVDYSILYGEYRYVRKELGEVTIVNDNDNSHIVDVDESSVCKILSKSILKKNVRYLRKIGKKRKRMLMLNKSWNRLALRRIKLLLNMVNIKKECPFMTDLKAGENEKVKLEAA